MKITIIGAGYVGLSLATLLSESNEVTILDIKQSKVDQINNRISPIVDKEIDDFFKNKQLNLNATSSEEAYLDSKFIIICTPTNYDVASSEFDVTTVEKVISDALKLNKKASIIIKSTRLVEELFTFIYHNQKAQALEGYNDDLVMSLSIGLWVRDTAL